MYTCIYIYICDTLLTDLAYFILYISLLLEERGVDDSTLPRDDHPPAVITTALVSKVPSRQEYY